MTSAYLYITPFFPSPTSWRGAYCLDFVRALMHLSKQEGANPANANSYPLTPNPCQVFVFKPGDGSDYAIDGITVHTFREWKLPSGLFPFLFRRHNERSFLAKVRSVLKLTPNSQSLTPISICHAHTAEFAIYSLAIKKLNPACQTLLHHHDLQSFGLNGGWLRHCWLYNLCLFPALRRLHEQIDCHVFISAASRKSFLAAPNTDWTDYADYKKQMRGLPYRPVRIKRSIILHNGVDAAIFNRGLRVGRIEEDEGRLQPIEGDGECVDGAVRRSPSNRRAMAEMKVEEWLAGVDDETFAAALEKLVEEKTAAGEYRFKRPEERELTISGARQFYRDFSRKIVPLSDGRFVYFAPDARSKKMNATNAVAWAEYAFHAVSSSGKLLDGKNFRERLYNATKAADLPVIESIIKAEQCMYRLIDAYPENDAVIFVGRDADNGRLEVLTRLDQFGNAEANLGEVTVIAKHKRKENPPPKFRPLTEVVEAVAKHQAAGFSPSTTGNNIANPSEADKGDGVNSNPSTLNPQPSTFTIGCIGNFVDLKDQATLIRAVGLLAEKPSRPSQLPQSSLRIIFVGTGPTLEFCKRLAADIESRINKSTTSSLFALHFSFEKEVPHAELADFYRSLDLFVLPSYFEGFGCVYTEAWSCGVPFIACEGQGIEDVIRPEDRELWLAKPHNPVDLSKKITAFMLNRPMQDLASAVAVSSVVSDFMMSILE